MAAPQTLTSNDLLFRLAPQHPQNSMNYTVIAQSADEVRDVESAPSVSMSAFLVSSQQTRLLTTLSIYSLRGSTRQQVRLLYMNEVALRIWKEMGKRPNVIGAQNRPPHAALLAFGVPFSE